MRFKSLPIAFIVAAVSATAAVPSSSTIGVVTASGHFNIEGTRAWGNATLFEGSRVETTTASSELVLRNGVKVQLSAASAARVFGDHLLLEKGAGQVTTPASYWVSAGTLKISATSGRFRVAFPTATRTIEIAALTGNTRVLNFDGTLVSSVLPGRSVTFGMQEAVRRAGCLVYKGNQYLLAIDNSTEVLQLAGFDLSANVGNRVEVTGTPSTVTASVEPAAGVLTVTAVAPRSVGGCLTTAAALNAQTSVPSATATPAAQTAQTTPAGTAPSAAQVSHAGMSTGAKVGIVAAAAGGGTAAIIVATHKKNSTSP